MFDLKFRTSNAARIDVRSDARSELKVEQDTLSVPVFSNDRQKLLIGLEKKLRKAIRSAFNNINLIESTTGQRMPSIRTDLRSLKKKLLASLFQIKSDPSTKICLSNLDRNIKSFMEKGQLPAFILSYSGADLSAAELEYRLEKIRLLKSKAVKTFKSGESIFSVVPADKFKSLKKVWALELKKIELVCSLYQAGLSCDRIRDLTGYNARNWLIELKLPPKLEMAGRDRYRKDFTIKTNYDEDSAYVLGSYAAVARVYTPEKGLALKSENKEKVEKFRSCFERAFKTTLHEARSEGDFFCISINRDLFFRDFLPWAGVVDESRMIIPYSVLKYNFTCSAFLQGFIDFSRGSFSRDNNSKSAEHFSVTRYRQSEVLKAVAVSMYFEGMLPSLGFKGERGSLVLYDKRDSACIANRLNKNSPLVAGSLKSPGLLGSADQYFRIMQAMELYYPAGTILNFEDLLNRAQIDYKPEDLTHLVKRKIQYWRRAKEPSQFSKVRVIQSYLKELYPQEAYVM